MTTNPDFLAEDLLLDAELLRQLANASRLHVCYLLAAAEHDVGTLAQKVGISQSALSQHLARLLQAGLVKVRRKSQNRYYRCDHPDVLTGCGNSANFSPILFRRLEDGP
ncbi:metalloregulator ArsR/SmtB family transcription factor [Rhizobium sp. VS19-DR104.2]|uniref:ArsR/SmtB family transcription factor n=1 Tax=unclassified Rhizobium TaxID=2613769 RepID=UPI001CC39737|nr:MULTISPECIES: metalloregulator ArsR/SmtB family transcription factor [unclassified Rhizobium]MBZ5763706.1 metalloregulator ArsR/SmtB family transcription factor [Rhizobium sp. VS19-DR96]MBZ5769630.1 metalloregulator ArsR/SmtB family transcription factor [Rhizobium sp. VS19-DR129.2]MBZ5777165.1 metalloregulator ArsR/SmtB family transcription factor [Rhizobium sp. VS19-DRK62.2]MBZ5788320.1 metalloregulator ArsR/SmtB family transcription factor [Rhizobium sp. VS19-DR121]MBZ5805773.1 metalloreg